MASVASREHELCYGAYALGGGESGSRDQDAGASASAARTPAARSDTSDESSDELSASDTVHDASASQQAGSVGTAHDVWR